MDSKRPKSHYILDKYGFSNKEVRYITGKGHGVMHNKFIIFDGTLLMTGSYNLSPNAEENSYENAIFISDKTVIEKYQTVFDGMWVE